MIDPTPIPIETCLTLDDAKRDPVVFNRYWFDLPGEWSTAANNERIIGIRSIWLLRCKRKLEYRISIRKYLKSDFRLAVNNYYSETEQISIHWPDEKYDEFVNEHPELLEKVVEYINSANVSELEIPITSWIDDDVDLKVIYKDIILRSKYYIDEYNNKNKNNSTKPQFKIDDNASNERDIQMDGVYIDKDFVEQLYSPRNYNSADPYYIDIKFKDMNDDFKNIMNISDDANDISCNYYHDYTNFSRSMNFKHCWDRGSCKLFSSLASQSNKNYLANTEVHFNPIKYFTLRSTDNRFYIDFYSAKHHNVPIKIPKDESFFIEIQLMQARKLLYI